MDSLVELIFTESSRQKKAVLLQNGETSTLQMQHKMIQMEHNHFFVKYQRKAKFLSKNSQKGVAFLRMRHLFGMNATHEQVKTTPSFGEIHYICDMKEIIETMPRIELALIIIGVFVLILGIILGYAMIHEYRIYLDDHYKARYSFRDFIKRERFYIYLFFVSIFIFLTNLLYFLA